MTEYNTLLEGIVGSTAYGLATPNSDIDILGVYASPTRDLFKLYTPKETLTEHNPDRCLHEAKKYVHLALNMNPTVYELLWLPRESYTVSSPLGLELIDIRPAFLSAPRVKSAYLGYAASQFNRLVKRNDGSFSSNTKNRSQKHAVHMARLIHQGIQLYTYGELTINVEQYAEWYHDFKYAGTKRWVEWFQKKRVEFERSETVLPDEPDKRIVEDWLLRVRKRYLYWD